MRRLLLLSVLLLPGSVSAQPAPVIATTVKTTSTDATSIQVGCAVGSSVCTGGIVAGPIDVTSVTSGGFIGIASNVPVSTTYRLYNNAGTLTWNGTPLAAGGSLTGTINTIPVFTAANSIGNSIMTQSGTTITVASTLNATTLGGTLSTATQNSVTTMTGLTSVGTIGTGTWQGTAVGLAYGGTAANLSGTGGTSQFLRQNTLGGAVTVIRPAVADLSDASNVPLLNAANTFTNGPQTIQHTAGQLVLKGAAVGNPVFQEWRNSGGIRRGYFGFDGSASSNFSLLNEEAGTMTLGNSAAAHLVLSAVGVLSVPINTTHTMGTAGVGTAATGLNIIGQEFGASGGAFLKFTRNATTIGFLGSKNVISGGTPTNALQLYSSHADGVEIMADNASGAIRFYSGGTIQRWSMSSAGHFVPGADNTYAVGGAGATLSEIWLSGVIRGTGGNTILTFADRRITAGTGTSFTAYFQMNASGTKPTCDSTTRGALYHTGGGVGTKDNVEVCAKDAADAYAWRTIY